MPIICHFHYSVFLFSLCKRFDSYPLPLEAFNSSPPPDTSYSNMAQLASEINEMSEVLTSTFLLTLLCDISLNAASVVTFSVSVE